MASHKSPVDRRIDIADRRIKLISRKREILGLSALESEHVTPKSSTQRYEDCIKSVELDFGKYSKKFSVFKKLIQDCKEQRITVRETEPRSENLFLHHPKLYRNFCNAVLPSLYRVSTSDEVDRANQFICSLEVKL
ncbi:hypothetical protein DCAR_0730000 [Daucus carota subsp. sativus]|uniref:Uncharacterized protein n=1 Tax=Daucus carota subsp. sativus TaxID=79200 RepID=A0AAF0XQ39_DAUCS|nr:PREDICTED: uncharacterized protein LOC108193880 [Daucus carota subsp. sativus]WOH10531.1 hypothetical protein DCAR_0730000 [Daucus carota subsp. sativus]